MNTTLKEPKRHRLAYGESDRRSIRHELDPTFYADIFAFRRAVAAGTVDVSKGCRNMSEYLRSVSHG